MYTLQTQYSWQEKQETRARAAVELGNKHGVVGSKGTEDETRKNASIP
jgi:hypothetical protein